MIINEDKIKLKRIIKEIILNELEINNLTKDVRIIFQIIDINGKIEKYSKEINERINKINFLDNEEHDFLLLDDLILKLQDAINILTYKYDEYKLIQPER